jgi:hypothetical protein
MVIIARPASLPTLLAAALGFAPSPAESAPASEVSTLEAPLAPRGVALVYSADPNKSMRPLPAGQTLAQADDLASPPSPGAIVTTPPPAPLVDAEAPPFPGYAWDPGHWVWGGAQYVWQPGNYIVQPTNGATYTPGYWKQYSGGWAWVDGRWSWGTQGEGE